MCGITGFFDISPHRNRESLHSIAADMTGTLWHRGPDDGGVWVDAETGIALGHRRLSIVDLSSEGHQPMMSASGRYVIVFNGEIYNFISLLQLLETQGHRFRGNSDTEVMLAAFEQWGLVEATKKFIGMFAFALWDQQDKALYLVRDRLGIKPLYYGWMGNIFLFGSELKSLKAHPMFESRINRDALALYLRHNYIPSPYSIYHGINKLLPGTILSIVNCTTAEPKPYWCARDVVRKGLANPFKGTEGDAVEQLDALLRDAVKLRMVADVPLGAFLSGGVDSSTVVALMQAQNGKPVDTFTIGFYEGGYNEAKDANAVAQYLGTHHTELYVTPEETMGVIPRLPALYDEPFADSSQIPTFLVSELARRHVTVSLSGDGGDELFAGYNRYFWGRSIWNKTSWMPGGLKNITAKGMMALSPTKWDWLFQKFGPVLPHSIKHRNTGDKLHKLAEILVADSPENMYLNLVSHWKHPTSLIPQSHEPPTVLNDRSQWEDLPDFTQCMMYLDLVTYLPDDILTKVDRASMGVSLEARVPLLDHRLVEFTWGLPLSMKIKSGQGKWLLRQLLYRYVPAELIERPKMGFGVPIDRWLRGPLREWAANLLDVGRIKREGFFRAEPINKMWREHLSGERNWQYHIWDVLMFQAWLDSQKTI